MVKFWLFWKVRQQVLVKEVDGGCEGNTKSRMTSKTSARDRGRQDTSWKSGQGSSGCLVGFKGIMHVECWRGHGESRENPE